MPSRIKRFLARYLPMSSRTAHEKFNELTALLYSQNAEMLAKDSELVERLTKALEDHKQVLLVEQQTILKEQKIILENQKKQREQSNKIQGSVEVSNKRAQSALENANEAVWAHIFNNTIDGSSWLQNRSFSPGRWGVGYQYLYVLYRILNEVKPRSILELGLGQSTRMIAQYAQNHTEVIHYVVEHDPEWIDFFARSFFVREQTKVVNLPLEMEAFMDDSVPVFSGFAETFAGQCFDLISIDAPFGKMSEVYSRIDILKLLPGCLADSFIILMDDYNRPNEKRTIELIKRSLDEEGIAYEMGNYYGQKTTCVITSEDLKFVCSM